MAKIKPKKSRSGVAGFARDGKDNSPSRILLVGDDGAGSVTLLVSDSPTHDEGEQAWTTSTRFGGSDSIWWQSEGLGSVSVEGILHADRPLKTSSVEARIAVLKNLRRPGERRESPPLVKVYGIPSAESSRWVVTGLSWGKRAFRGDGTLLYQWVTVSLGQHREGGTIEDVTLRATRDRRTGRRKTRPPYTVRSGDTLRSVALRQIGREGAFVKIQKANKSVRRTNPEALLRPGLKLIIPE